MGLRLALVTTVALSLSACATVDLTDVTAPKASSASKIADVNVVQRAAAKLYTAFTTRGFVAKDSRKKMRSAARVLLKGLEDKDSSSSISRGYAALATDPIVVTSDIRIAASHVEQTTKAAEVYLAMAPSERSLRKELVSLEKALIASREASQVFEDALIKTAGQTNAMDFRSYQQSVDALRDVTNAFGDRVREAQFTKVAQIN